MLYVVAIVALVSSTVAASQRKVQALQCGPCDPATCPAIGECRRGITWDVCGCCEACSKSLGEECGGPWNAYGKCGYGLTCLKDARHCPYIFNARGTAEDTGSNICDEYLFNAIGQCVEGSNLLESAFKRRASSRHRLGDPSEAAKGTKRDLELDGGSLVGKRLMLKGVLRGVEY
ncbi:uncharacterized protein LOC143037860 isoform X2 [Oratosquilla oratoria]